MKKIRAATIRSVVEHLSELGLSVYGPNVDLEEEAVYPACRDFDVEDILKLRKILRKYPKGLPEKDYPY